MTLQEFKAWFEGYSESIEDAPTMKQWKRIKSRVAEIDGIGITHTVFVDRYWDYRRYPYVYGPQLYGNACGLSSALANAAFQNANQCSAAHVNNAALQSANQGSAWNSCSAMSSLGAADGAVDRQ